MDRFAINKDDDETVPAEAITKNLSVDSSIYALAFVAMLKSVEKEYNLKIY